MSEPYDPARDGQRAPGRRRRHGRAEPARGAERLEHSSSAWTCSRALRGVAEDEAVRAVLITGAGRAFSSGADLKDFSGGETTADGRPDVYKTLTERYHPIMHAIREMPKPVVASVNGPAVGIGCSLALCCDLIVAAESAYFLLAFVNIGLVPDGGSSLFVPTRVGMARATEMAMLGERLPAAQALEWGLINRVVPDEQPARGGGHARRATGRRTDALLRRHQAPAQQLAVRADGRAARAGGPDPAGDGGQRRLPRGRDGVRREAPGALLRQVDRHSWQKSSSASRPRLNRIPAALGHLLPSTLAFFTPAVGRVAQREPDRQPLQDHAVHRARDLRRRRGRPRLCAV